MFFLFEKHKFTFMTPVKGLTADIKSFKEGVNVLEFPLFFFHHSSFQITPSLYWSTKLTGIVYKALMLIRVQR